MQWFIFLGLALFLLIFAPSSKAANTSSNILLTEESTHIAVDNFTIYEDTKQALTIEHFLEKKVDHLQPIQQGLQAINFGLSSSALWGKVNITNHSNITSWNIAIIGSLSRQADIFLFSEKAKSYQHFSGGSSQRSHHINVTIPLQPQETYQLYIRVTDKHAPLFLYTGILNQKLQFNALLQENIIYIFMFGGLATLIIYNFLYFLYLKDIDFLLTSIFSLTFAGEVLNHLGALYLIAGNQGLLASIAPSFGFIALATGGIMSIRFLELKTNSPRVFYISLTLVIAALIAIPLTPWLKYITGYTSVMGGIFLIMNLGNLIYLHHRKVKIPTSLTLSFSITAISILIFASQVFDIIPTSTPITGGQLGLILIAMIFLSMTQAERTKIMTKQSERRFAASQAKDELLTTMSHELRTPMNAVISAGVLLDNTQLSSQQFQYVSRLNIASKHMLELINDILDLARIERSKLMLEHEPFVLDDIVQSLHQLLSELAEKKGLQLSLENEFKQDNICLLGDAVRLKQVLINLLGNAIKFTDKGKVKFHILISRDGAKDVTLTFKISDTGIGMNAYTVEQLFNPFYQAQNTTARQYSGSGLGLSISQKIIQQMGGEISVVSKEGVGSEFSFQLSFNTQKVTRSTHKQAIPTIQETLHILLVDDDEMNRFFGKAILSQMGLQVTLAEDATQAIQEIHDHTYDIILMDISMPHMDGYEATKILRSQFKLTTPIIALTAHSNSGERERCLAAGMNDYLRKPLETQRIYDVLSQYTNKT